MINGNINEFIDKIWDGQEVVFVYNNKKYFVQGYIIESGDYVLELQMWEPEEKMLWSVSGKDNQESYEEFLTIPAFDGKTFWQIEKEAEWVDY